MNYFFKKQNLFLFFVPAKTTLPSTLQNGLPTLLVDQFSSEQIYSQLTLQHSNIIEQLNEQIKVWEERQAEKVNNNTLLNCFVYIAFLESQ
jgi:hypothetical protein